MIFIASLRHRQMGHRYLQDRRIKQQQTADLRRLHSLPDPGFAQIAGHTAQDLCDLHDDPRGSLRQRQSLPQ